MDRGRDALLRLFRWCDGHADIWPIFNDAAALRAVVDALASRLDEVAPDAVVGVESRGFLLGGAVAVELGVGFVPIRKEGTIFPGPKYRRRTQADYRSNRTTLAIQREALHPGQQVALVDDWIETGSQARTVAELVAACGASLSAIAVLVDQTSPSAARGLPHVRALVRAEELPGDSV